MILNIKSWPCRALQASSPLQSARRQGVGLLQTEQTHGFFLMRPAILLAVCRQPRLALSRPEYFYELRFDWLLVNLAAIGVCVDTQEAEGSNTTINILINSPHLIIRVMN